MHTTASELPASQCSNQFIVVQWQEVLLTNCCQLMCQFIDMTMHTERKQQNSDVYATRRAASRHANPCLLPTYAGARHSFYIIAGRLLYCTAHSRRCACLLGACPSSISCQVFSFGHGRAWTASNAIGFPPLVVPCCSGCFRAWGPTGVGGCCTGADIFFRLHHTCRNIQEYYKQRQLLGGHRETQWHVVMKSAWWL